MMQALVKKTVQLAQEALMVPEELELVAVALARVFLELELVAVALVQEQVQPVVRQAQEAFQALQGREE
jgi:hypothetical protein